MRIFTLYSGGIFSSLSIDVRTLFCTIGNRLFFVLLFNYTKILASLVFLEIKPNIQKKSSLLLIILLSSISMEAYPYSPISWSKKVLLHIICAFSFILLRNNPTSLDKLILETLVIFSILANSFVSIKLSFKLLASTKQ